MPPAQIAHNPKPGGLLGGTGLAGLLDIALGLAGTTSSNSLILKDTSDSGSAIRYHSNYPKKKFLKFLLVPLVMKWTVRNSKLSVGREEN